MYHMWYGFDTEEKNLKKNPDRPTFQILCPLVETRHLFFSALDEFFYHSTNIFNVLLVQ